MTRSFRSFALAVCLAVPSAALWADSITVGLPALPGTGNCIPFGCPQSFGVTTFQEVYNSAAFPSAITITGIDFFNLMFVNGGTPAPGTFSFSLSYTSKAIGALDLTNPLNNITSGSQAFFSGPLPGLSGGVLALTGTPFLYNPALGNLLLTVGVAGGLDPPLNLFLDQSVSSTQTSRAYFGSGDGNDGGALVTRFNTPVPEPATLSLAGLGLLIAMLVAARRKRASA